MNEGVKISKKTTFFQMCRKGPIYTIKLLFKNLKNAPISFYSQLQFLHVSHYTRFGRGVE